MNMNTWPALSPQVKIERLDASRLSDPGKSCVQITKALLPVLKFNKVSMQRETSAKDNVLIKFLLDSMDVIRRNRTYGNKKLSASYLNELTGVDKRYWQPLLLSLEQNGFLIRTSGPAEHDSYRSHGDILTEFEVNASNMLDDTRLSAYKRLSNFTATTLVFPFHDELACICRYSTNRADAYNFEDAFDYFVSEPIGYIPIPNLEDDASSLVRYIESRLEKRAVAFLQNAPHYSFRSVDGRMLPSFVPTYVFRSGTMIYQGKRFIPEFRYEAPAKAVTKSLSLKHLPRLSGFLDRKLKTVLTGDHGIELCKKEGKIFRQSNNTNIGGLRVDYGDLEFEIFAEPRP